MSFDSGIPTQRLDLILCSLSTHKNDAQCHCVCHKYDLIMHLRPCCVPCPECKFQVVSEPDYSDYMNEPDYSDPSDFDF